jgi:hypothetical protein
LVSKKPIFVHFVAKKIQKLKKCEVTKASCIVKNKKITNIKRGGGADQDNWLIY